MKLENSCSDKNIFLSCWEISLWSGNWGRKAAPWDSLWPWIWSDVFDRFRENCKRDSWGTLPQCKNDQHLQSPYSRKDENEKQCRINPLRHKTWASGVKWLDMLFCSAGSFIGFAFFSSQPFDLPPFFYEEINIKLNSLLLWYVVILSMSTFITFPLIKIY